jgi:hypothetical protein
MRAVHRPLCTDTFPPHRAGRPWALCCCALSPEPVMPVAPWWQVTGTPIQGAADMLKRFLHHVESTLPAYFQWCFDTAAGTLVPPVFIVERPPPRCDTTSHVLGHHGASAGHDPGTRCRWGVRGEHF